jgi:hypothetical protein
MSPADRKPLAGRLAGALAWRVFVSLSYTTGLTLLIPFVAVRLLPAEFRLVPVGTSPALLAIAVGLILGALVVRLWATRSLSGSLKALGWMTFAPGFVGVVVALLGRETLLARLAERVPRFEDARPALELYLDRAVPQVRYLTVGFFVAGVALLLAGSWLTPRRREPGS